MKQNFRHIQIESVSRQDIQNGLMNEFGLKRVENVDGKGRKMLGCQDFQLVQNFF